MGRETPSRISFQNTNLQTASVGRESLLSRPTTRIVAAPDDFHPRFRYDRLSIADRVGANRERNRERNSDPIEISRVDSADRGNSWW